jgi:signal transduction histidine kinase/ActR/RegA family two-component response regulator
MKQKFLSLLETAFLIMFLALTLGIMVTTFKAHKSIEEYATLLQSDISSRLKLAASHATKLLEESDFEAFKSTEDMGTELWESKRAQLIAFAKEYNVQFVYFVRYVGDTLQYVIDNDLDPETMVTPGMETEPDGYVHLAFSGDTVSTDMGNYAGIWDGLMSAYAPVYGSDGKVLAVAGVDITDTAMIAAGKHINSVNRMMYIELASVLFAGLFLLFFYRRRAKGYLAAYEAKTQFLSMMSHEIRTPMNAIIGISDILVSDPDLALGPRQYVEDIQAAANALLSIINDILDLSKLELGKMRLTPVNYNFNKLVDNLMTMARFLAAEKNVNIVLDCQVAKPTYLFGDDVRLRQVLLNIIGNAIKFTQNGTVALRAQEIGDKLVFDIIDTGIGIKKEDLPFLFDAFKQVDTDKNRHIKGTGLGLSVSKYLVELMNGSISVESEYGQGSTFRIVIPKIKGQKPKLAKKAQPNLNYGFSVMALVVDDNELNLTVASGLLRIHGIKADQAISGQQALEKVAKNDYQLIFMDQMMPEMDGLETTANIRAMGGRLAELPIIALTANAMAGAKETLIAGGMNDFLTKPIQRDELSAILAKWVPIGQSAQPAQSAQT